MSFDPFFVINGKVIGLVVAVSVGMGTWWSP